MKNQEKYKNPKFLNVRDGRKLLEIKLKQISLSEEQQEELIRFIENLLKESKSKKH